MIRVEHPRCADCACPLAVSVPVIRGAWQQVRCPSCRVHLRLRQVPAAPVWEICTLAEATHQDAVPLRPVASPEERQAFFRASCEIARLVPGVGVEPGMADLVAEPA